MTNEIAAATQARMDTFNAQQQPRITWPDTTQVARAYLDQLARRNVVTSERAAAAQGTLDRADQLQTGRERNAATMLGEIERLAEQFSRDAAGAGQRPGPPSRAGRHAHASRRTPAAIAEPTRVSTPSLEETSVNASRLWSCKRLSLLMLCLLAVALWPASLTSTPAAVAQEQEWSIEDPGGPTTLLEYTATEGTWLSVDVSPDGQRLAFDLLGHIYEMPVAGGDARRLTDGRSWNLSPRYSPDGSRLAFTSDRSGSFNVWVLDRAVGHPVQRLELGRERVSPVMGA